MRICIVNKSSLPDEKVLQAIRVINTQLVDFAYHWSVVAQLRLEGTREGKLTSLKELRGDGLIYLTDMVQKSDALGWHDASPLGIPYGVVQTALEKELWTAALSHEVLEMLLDPHVNRLAAGPHPTDNRTVFYWYEACDAVQRNVYEIGGVPVSDFVLPAYFTTGEEKGCRMSYLGAKLKSFGVAPGAMSALSTRW